MSENIHGGKSMAQITEKSIEYGRLDQRCGLAAIESPDGSSIVTTERTVTL
jgi:hypothetical protein